MRVSAAKVKIKKILYSVLPAIVFIIYAMVSFAACTIGDNTISDEYGNMNITYGEDGIIRNGTEYYTYQVEDGYSGVVSVCIAKKAGRIDIDIYPTDCKEHTNYKGRDLDSATFSVVLSEANEYKVRITVKDFVGEYEISWKIEEKK